MVRTALAIGRKVDDTRSIWDMGAIGKRKGNQSPSSSRKKQKTSASYGFQGRGRDYQGQGQVGASSQTKQMTCYHYHHPEHIRRDYPQRQGSRNYGTSQVQSFVGYAWTQFVPPYPSMGQGNQYQSQGAAQEPYATQTGQRGQGMGRGQSSRAKISRTQGRVYAITPQTEPVDQSLIQGMFLLSLTYGKRYCLIRMHHIHIYCYIMCERFGLRG